MSPKDRFQYQVATGRGTLPAVTLLTLMLWGISAAGHWTDLGSLLTFGLVAYLMIETDTRFALIRTRTTLPASLFLLAYAVIPFMHAWSTSSLLPLLFIAQLFSLFKCFEAPDATTEAFHAFFWLSLASLIFSPLIWIAPLMYAHMAALRSLSPRTFCAGLVGLSLPYGLLASYCICNDRIADMLPLLAGMIHFPSGGYTDISLTVAVSGIVTAGLFIVYAVCYLQSASRDKVQSRILLRTTVWMGTWILILMILQPRSISRLLPLLCIASSFIGGQLFALTFNRNMRILFYSTLTLWGLLCLFNLWILFFNF